MYFLPQIIHQEIDWNRFEDWFLHRLFGWRTKINTINNL
jgi:hypothetical protein